MFDFFKKKIQGAFSKFSQGVDKEAKVVEEAPEPIKQTVEPKIVQPLETSKVKSVAQETKTEQKKDSKYSKKTDKKELKTEELKQDISKDKIPNLKQAPIVLNSQSNVIPIQNKKNIFSKIFKKKSSTLYQPGPHEVSDDVERLGEELLEKKKSFLDKISDSLTKKVLSERQFDELFWDLEISLLENNVAVEVVDLLKSELRKKLVDVPLERNKISLIIESTLKETVEKIFELEPIDMVAESERRKPYKILIVGINGSGKTTSIAKLCRMFQNEHKKVVVAASDTFRAAAIDQLEEHMNNLKVKMIKHDYGSDPAAVAFDAIKYAESKKMDIVIIDTAGRLHSNVNLMDELKKVYRIAKPDIVLFVGESITGNDCVEQAREFNKVVTIDGIILSKADVDEKGGAAISISYVLGKPILFLGVGQGYDDLEVFDKNKMMYRMFGTELRG